MKGLLLPGILTTSLVGTGLLPVQAATAISSTATTGVTDVATQAVVENDPVEEATSFSRFRRGFRRGGFRRGGFGRRRFRRF
ncbi:MAG: hypothetical protein F6K19_34710 [Cyanothece sp. SIO1E1]|nr:hypothetical protein [Cyanothece sp. SIO1E1]